MPGSFIIKPIEANITHNTDLLRKMSPYCAVSAGGAKIKGQVCKKGGKQPHWNDAITIPATTQPQVLVELMDRDTITRDDNIGSLMLDLREVRAAGQVSKWYPLTYKNKAAGEILLETVYQPDSGYGNQRNSYQQRQQYGYGGMTGHNRFYQQNQYQSGYSGHSQRQEVYTGASVNQSAYSQQGMLAGDLSGQYSQQGGLAGDLSGRAGVWVEQRQVVQPHKFMKEVEVIETVTGMQEVEVYEPVKVMREVPYTTTVPVTRQIEVSEPQVVVKDIEVMEPRLITKTIQVVENVPVKRHVEVVEMRSTIQEVDTMEPQTFTTQVEVTEYMPVKKQVEVTQPVTLKKAVEYVEPVVTTQTITKEQQEAVIISQEVTTSVGPVSVIGMSKEYGYIQNYGEISLTERERIGGLKRWVGFEKLFIGLTEQERLFEQQRLSRLSEQEWLREQQRLLALSEQDRLIEQRRFYNTYYTSRPGGVTTTTVQKRWTGNEHLFGGLNEKERLFEQERWNRFSEQEWLQEQKRLAAFNQQDRLLEQRRLYNDYLKTGGFSSYKKTTEVIETTTTGQANSLNRQRQFSPNHIF